MERLIKELVLEMKNIRKELADIRKCLEKANRINKEDSESSERM